MKVRQLSRLKIFVALFLTLVLLAIPVSSASAHTAKPGVSYFDNRGHKVQAKAWIQNFSWSGCGNFQTTVEANVATTRVKNRTVFYEIGVGSISIKGLNIGSSRKGERILEWTNTNGAKGSYLSGNVCMGWGASYLGLDVYGTAVWKGVVRTPHARI